MPIYLIFHNIFVYLWDKFSQTIGNLICTLNLHKTKYIVCKEWNIKSIVYSSLIHKVMGNSMWAFLALDYSGFVCFSPIFWALNDLLICADVSVLFAILLCRGFTGNFLSQRQFSHIEHSSTPCNGLKTSF